MHHGLVTECASRPQFLAAPPFGLRTIDPNVTERYNTGRGAAFVRPSACRGQAHALATICVIYNTIGDETKMNWKAIVRHYKAEHYPRHSEEKQWFSEQASLTDAIHNATHALDRNTKRYSHQRWLTTDSAAAAETRLAAIRSDILSAESFHSLFLAIETALKPVCGAGELYIYDVAFRVGAYLELHPEKVYLHSGTRVGADALAIGKSYRWLDPSDIPREIQNLSPAECEDILCIYKDKFVSPSAPPEAGSPSGDA